MTKINIKANLAGCIFLTFLILLLFLFIGYIYNIGIIYFLPIYVGIYIAWSISALYFWNNKPICDNARDWFLISLYSIPFALAGVLLEFAESYIFTGSIIREDMSLSQIINIMIVVSCCPGLTFTALAGAVRALFIKYNTYLGD